VTRKSRSVLLGVKLPHHAMVTIMQTPTAVQNENNTLVAKKNTQCFGNRTIEYCIKHSSSGPRLCGTKKLILDIEAVAQAWLVQIQSVIFLSCSISITSLLSSLFSVSSSLLSFLSFFALSSVFSLLSSLFSIFTLYLISSPLSFAFYLFSCVSSLTLGFCHCPLDAVAILCQFVAGRVSLLRKYMSSLKSHFASEYQFCANQCLH